ncbi:STAS domain-containing protein [Candidatus Oscillochloris fontis]|uniref:STAS domain-containing protein n=1 Tax=Candidatus Oscillochloris fontis TaxID=2496868 RepID=UPI00101C5646|nr:STAS domain-containing protein [Candidatus Oscillochloris fontis]
MLELFSRYLLMIVAAALATYVIIRAGTYPPARLLVLVITLFVAISLNSALRQVADTLELAYWLASTNVVLLGLVSISVLLLLSRIFIPEWWQGRRPIIWIGLPYLLVTMFLVIDLFGRTGLIFTGIAKVGNRMVLQGIHPRLPFVIFLFSASWLIHVAVLIAGFVRQPQQRKTIVILMVGFSISILSGLLVVQVPALASLQTLATAIPVLGSLAYAVLRTQLLVPTQAAFDLAVAAIRDVVLVITPDGELLYANPAAQDLGLISGRSLADAMAAVGVSAEQAQHLLCDTDAMAEQDVALTLAGRQVVVNRTSVRDRRGHTVGQLLLGRDMTELEQRGAQLEAERMRLAATVQALESRERERDDLVATVRALALPVIPILNGVLVLPLVGDFDAVRAQQLTALLLQAIERERARLVLLDITGVPLLDQAGAVALAQATRSAALLGARCILVGVRPEIAQTLVSLGALTDEIPAMATLQQALQQVLDRR